MDKVPSETQIFRRKYPSASTYYNRRLPPVEAAKEWILFEGTNSIKQAETINFHGVEFEKGYVYHVTPELFEYLKVFRGFKPVTGVKEEMTGMPGQPINTPSSQKVGSDQVTAGTNTIPASGLEPLGSDIVTKPEIRKRGRPKDVPDEAGMGV